MRPSANQTLLSKMQQNIDTTNVFTPNLTDNYSAIGVRKQAAITIINNISTQNKLVESQLKSISVQMGKIASLGQYLMNQNKSLRIHYQNRSNDLNQLLESIKINVHENTNDITQQIHLLKASNLQTFKNIKKHNQQLQQLVNQISKTKQSLEHAKQSSINDELAKFRNKYNDKNIDKLLRQQQKLARSQKQLQEEVVRLSIEVGALWKQNTNRKHQKNQQNYNNINDKDKYRMNIVATLKSITNLQKDKKQLQGQLQKMHNLTSDQRTLNNKLTNQSLQAFNKKQQKLLKLTNIHLQRSNKNKILQEHRKNIHQQQINRLKKVEQLEALKKKVNNKKKQLLEKNKKNQSKLDGAQEEYNQKINEIKKKIRQNQKKTNDQLEAIQKKSDQISINHDNLINQYNLVEGDCHDYQNTLTNMQNPAEQIQRAQLILNIKKRKPIMSNIINRL